MANSVLPMKCRNFVHGRCARIEKVTTELAMHFACLRCRVIMEGIVDLIKTFGDEVKTVNGFCYFVEELKASGG